MKLTTPIAGLAAGLLVATGALAGATVAGGGDARDRPTPLAATAAASTGDDVSGPCDEAEHAGDPRCTGTPGAGGTATPDDDGDATAAPAPAGELRSFAAGSAGVVSYTVDGAGFHLASATPADGWAVEVEQAAGDELDLDFRRGTVRVQVDVEHEDGQVRERVRVRDDATDERSEDEVVVGSPSAAAPAPTVGDDHGGDIDRDDRVEPGDDRDADDDADDRDDDSSGHGDDGDDRVEDDSSGHGGDDDGDDDD